MLIGQLPLHELFLSLLAVVGAVGLTLLAIFLRGFRRGYLRARRRLADKS